MYNMLLFLCKLHYIGTSSARHLKYLLYFEIQCIHVSIIPMSIIDPGLLMMLCSPTAKHPAACPSLSSLCTDTPTPAADGGFTALHCLFQSLMLFPPFAVILARGVSAGVRQWQRWRRRHFVSCHNLGLLVLLVFLFLSWLFWDAACCWLTSCLLSSSWPWDHHWPHRVAYGVRTKVGYIYLKSKGKPQPLNPDVHANTQSGQEHGKAAESVGCFVSCVW